VKLKRRRNTKRGSTSNGGRSAMNDEPETTDVVVNGPSVVEIDAERIAQLIFDVCHTSEARAARAANEIISYLAQVLSQEVDMSLDAIAERRRERKTS
jgi:hypothetical protein